MHFTDESKINENLCHEHVASLPYACMYAREGETKNREREKEFASGTHSKSDGEKQVGGGTYGSVLISIFMGFRARKRLSF